MKRITKILLGLILSVVIACAAFVIWQWRNVKPLYAAKTASTEEIVRRAEASKEQQRRLLEENEIQVLPPSLDQMDRLIDGQASSAELKTELGLADTAERVLPSPAAAPTQETAETLTEEQRAEKAREQIDRCVKDLYAYELDLVADLSTLKQEASREYRALPKEEQTRQNAVKLGYRYLNQCYDREVASDRTVQAILKRLRADLKALETDTAIVDTLWAHYCEEKMTTKEYYLSKYL